MNINTIIFDLDNTLINRKLAFEQYTYQFIENYISFSDTAEKDKIAQYIIAADRDGYRSKKELYQELMENLKWNKETTLTELLEYWFSSFYTCTVLMDGAIDVIHYLRDQGLKLGIITNGSVRAQNAKIDYAGIRELFDVIVVSDEVQVKKPDKRIYNIALDRLAVKAETAVYIGDHPRNDIKGAHETGLKTIWLEGFKEWDVMDVQPDYTVNELKEIIKILDNNNLALNRTS